MKICIQAGHVNTATSSTGAPNEMAFNLDIANTVSGELRKRGFEVKQTDANADKDKSITTPINWDLFLAIHYDADIYGTGGYFVDYPEPSTDGATQESQRIQKVLSDEYGKVTGIINHPERSNANTRYYYMWKSLSPKTPCCLIECGVGMHVPDDWQILHFDRPRVVEGLVRGICKAFNVPYDIVVLPPEPPQNPPSESTDPSYPDYTNDHNILLKIKEVVSGKGFWWTKYAKIKELVK
jgi:N-acetylmuramoyl-L-alanine amidase